MSAGSEFRAALRLRASAHPCRVALPEATDPRTLEAASHLTAEGIAKPILVGDPAAIAAAWSQGAFGAELPLVVDPADGVEARAAHLFERRKHKGVELEEARRIALDPLYCAALMVALGEADGSVAGALRTTAEVIRAGLWCVGASPGVRTVSSAFYMTVPEFRGRGPETLTFTDAGVVQYPDAEQLCDIAVSAVAAREQIVGDVPVVAFLSHSTLGSAEGPSVDRVRAALALFRDRRPDVAAEGELQGDAALIRSVAERKAPDSPSAGSANILVFPDLDSANIAYKLTERLAGGEAVGPIVQGLARPCNDLSRGANSADIVDAVAVTALMAKVSSAPS